MAVRRAAGSAMRSACRKRVCAGVGDPVEVNAPTEMASADTAVSAAATRTGVRRRSFSNRDRRMLTAREIVSTVL